MASQDKIPPNDIANVVAMFQRHAGKFIGIFLLGIMLSLSVAFSLPPVYRSTATILIERQEIPDEIVTSTVSGYIEARLAAIERRILTKDNLWRIIEQLDLYPELRQQGERNQALAQMRENILRETVSVETVNPSSGKAIIATVAFTLSFDHQDPATAQRVANELAQGYLRENSAARTEQASQVARFLTAEAERLERLLSGAEQRLAAFKQQHLTELPEYTEVNRSLLEQTESSLTRSEQRIHALQQRQKQLQTELALMQSQSPLYTASGKPVLSLDQELNVLRAELAQARTKYSERHPDVIKLNQEIKALEQQLRSQDTTDAAAAPLPLSQTALIAFKAQLNGVEDDLRMEQANRRQLQEKIVTYRQRLSRAPAVERDYLQLVRARDSILQSYQEIQDKQVEARLAEQLEREHRAERFNLVEPASLPLKPESPNRPGIALLGTVLALGSSIGWVSVAEYRDRSVHGVTGLQQVLQAPPLAVIPYIETDTERQRRHRRRMQWLTLLALLALLGLALLYWYNTLDTYQSVPPEAQTSLQVAVRHADLPA